MCREKAALLPADMSTGKVTDVVMDTFCLLNHTTSSWTFLNSLIFRRNGVSSAFCFPVHNYNTTTAVMRLVSEDSPPV